MTIYNINLLFKHANFALQELSELKCNSLYQQDCHLCNAEDALKAIKSELEKNIVHQQDTELPPNMKTVTFDSNKYKLVPIDPTPEMIEAACQDGVNLGTKPVWKHTVDVQAKWKWKQMIDASPNIE